MWTRDHRACELVNKHIYNHRNEQTKVKIVAKKQKRRLEMESLWSYGCEVIAVEQLQLLAFAQLGNALIDRHWLLVPTL